MARRLLTVIISTIALFLSVNTVNGEDTGRFSITGKVVENGTNEPLFMATVVVKELGLWSVTDDNGNFIITNIPKGKYTLEFSSLGFQTRELVVEIKKDVKTFTIKMDVSSLSLDEVVVTAKEGGEITTSSKISAQTIEHIQPSSLKDVMQLLPGSITENPNLTSVNSLSIRDIGSNTANAIGTALIVDGASLSNDANLQSISTGSLVNSTSDNTASTAGGGVDARQVSTDNIESVQVIRGIPSAEYGDLTSGAVVVKTKAGVTPWEVRIKADPQLKQISGGKGFSIGEKGGIVNFDVDYAKAYQDIRTPASAYDRVNFQAGYSNNFAKKLTFNVKLRGNYSNASTISDPDLFLDEIKQQKERGLRLNINGRWIINKPWITNIEYMVTGSIAEQYTRNKVYQGSAGYTPTSEAMTDGENIGFFTPAQYYSDVSIYGTPIDAQGKLTANLFGRYGDVTNKVLIGGEWKMQGNNGAGKVFDLHLPPSPGSASASRERSYYEIPFLHRFTAYAEDNIKLPISSTSLEIQAGGRLNYIFAKGINTSNFFTIEPRFNAKYNIIDKRRGLKKLSVRGGWGITYKMPSMTYLFPEDAYTDLVSYSYNDIDANDYGLAVITTKKLDTSNPHLKPQKSVNFEAGIDIDGELVGGSLVYFNEKMTNGYGFVQEFVPMQYRRYGYTWVDGEPSQENLESGKYPEYQDGRVVAQGKTLSSISDTTFMSYYKPVNGITNDKWGIEYTIDFAKIESINTSINISGAYMNIRSTKTEQTSSHYSGTSAGRTFPYVGIYSGASTSSNGSLRERLSTNVRFITHIPEIAMVVTLTAQMVFMDRTTSFYELNGESLPYYYDESGQRVSGNDALLDSEHTKYINPLYIMDRKGNIIPFTQEMERDEQYRNLLITTNTGTYYQRANYPFYGLLNLRLTKEIKNIATISFYANNFLNLKGEVKNSVTGYPQRKNSPIYFGAEIKISLK